MSKRSPSFWLPKPVSSKIEFHVHGVSFMLNADIMAKRSSVIDSLVKENPHKEHLFDELRDIPSDPKTFELVARFCHGFELKLSPENVIPLCCVADFLGMSESHSPNNLVMKCQNYFQQRILHNWNESVIALRSTASVIQQAAVLGLIEDCFKSLIHKALEYPQLLGEPVRNSSSDDEEEDDDDDKPIVQRTLLKVESESKSKSKLEDLASLPLKLYEPLINEMIENRIPGIYITSSLCRFAKNSPNKRVMEVIEKLLPHEIGLLPCPRLFEMLRISITTETNSNCRNGFETRIGKQLDEATVQDLLIISSAYSKKGGYDSECVRRILKTFYNNIAAASDDSRIISVAELIEDFLSEIAGDVNLRVHTFISLAEISSSVSIGMERSSDELYRAIDIYLDKHSYLTESEREKICQVLDCHRLSPAMCQHAALNNRLPLRIVVQVLFVGQLHLRDVIKREVHDPTAEGEETPLITGDRKASRSIHSCSSNSSSNCKEEVMMEMERMGKKVRELEREYCTMKKEIENSISEKPKPKEKEKVSMWKEMKMKLGCVKTIHDVACHVKKKKIHPKK